MKKLFLSMVFFCTYNINNCSTSDHESFLIHYKVKKGFGYLASKEALFQFIHDAISWHKNSDQIGSIQSSSSNEKKELKVTAFHKLNEQAITTTWWIENIHNDPHFLNQSIWNRSGDQTTDEIDKMFLDVQQDATKPAQEYLAHLQQVVHCFTNTNVTFNPQIDHRTAQRIDTFLQDNTTVKNLLKNNPDVIQQSIQKKKNYYQRYMLHNKLGPYLQQRRDRNGNPVKENNTIDSESEKPLNIYNKPETFAFSTSNTPTPSPAPNK